MIDRAIAYATTALRNGASFVVGAAAFFIYLITLGSLIDPYLGLQDWPVLRIVVHAIIVGLACGTIMDVVRALWRRWRGA